MSTLPILFIEKHGAAREAIQKLLQSSHYQILATELADVTRLLGKHKPALSIIGPAAAKLGGFDEVVLRIREESAETPVMLMTGESSEDLAIAALRAGIKGYLRYPCQREDLESELERCIGRHSYTTVSHSCETTEMIGNSEPMQSIKTYLHRIAPTDSTVLITGETGTGKEVAADLIYRRSSRKNFPFVTINCAAIPDSLLESELFGYERGAFTGAHSAHKGKLKAAHGGTILLDEIGDMSAYAQAKILRVIDNKQIQRLGDLAMTPVNIRIIAATNQELETLVNEGKFRKDLFFRLNVGRVHLPPLRERKEDIPELVTYHLQRMSAKLGIRPCSLAEDAWPCLLNYEWPGNVRELKNTLEIVLTHANSPEISGKELPHHLRRQAGELTSATGDERKRLLYALSAADWNKSRAAEKLRWSRMTLYRKMAKYQISKEAAI